jgi:hypothetical protein
MGAMKRDDKCSLMFHVKERDLSTTRSSAIIIARMLISTRKPRHDLDRHAIQLRDVAMRIVAMYGSSYSDGCIIIEHRAACGDRPNGLDIWLRDDRSTKVLNIIWHGDEAMVVSYRSGPWERALALAASASVIRAVV